ncbi:YcbK family protein [Helicobacter winghamensis]|uniref:YcbK family protein n=1 Tax=Helicobacter winghamensis TaxID=157268 RepID=UPI0027A5B25F
MLENPYFKEQEFDCKCGKCKRPPNIPSDALVSKLCTLREHFNAPILINSAYRCPSHNAKVGGAKTSQHTIGSAVDFVIKGIKTQEVYNFVLEVFGEEPLGIAIKRNPNNPFAGFVHLDTRGKKARWEYK